MSSRLGALLAAGVAALMMGLLARSVIDHVPLYDELLHYLAAQGLIHRGRPAIAGGEYTRALLFTQLVADALRAWGDNLRAARMPSLLAGMLLAAALTAWTARRVGLLAGLAAAAVLLLVPASVELAVLCRFYMLHALVIFALAVAAYDALSPRSAGRRRWLLLVLMLVLLALAWHLQPTTLIAAGAIACGAAAVAMADHWPLVRRLWARHAAVIVVAISAVAAALVWLLLHSSALRALNVAPVWASWAASAPHYYLLSLGDRMPLLWPLFPVVVVFAWQQDRRLTLYCSVVFAAALIVHSLAAAKAERYLYYAMPLFCVLWGSALAAVSQRVSAWRRGRGGADGRLLLVAASVCVLALSGEGQRGARLLLGRSAPAQLLSYAVEPDWRPAVPRLQPAVAGASRIVTSNAMKALYYLGRYDFELNVSIVSETSTGQDFGVDGRTGARAIGSAASLQSVIAGPGNTLVVLEDRKLDSPQGVPTAAVQLIRRRCVPIDLPAGSGLSAWQCTGG